MSPEETILNLQERLREIAKHRPYRFQNTTRADAEAHLARSTTFVGFDEGAVTAAEIALGVEFTDMFRIWMQAMGRRCGDLFRGSDLARPSDLVQWRFDVFDLREEVGFRRLPEDAVIFLMHQGYAWNYTSGSGGSDAPVWAVTEGDPEPTQVADCFSDFLFANADLLEEVAEMQRANGGHWLTVTGRQVTESHPALSSGERPIDRKDDFLD